MIDIKKICYIIGACSNNTDISFQAHDNDFVIAADGGYDFLKKMGIEADVLIGDFDSISVLPEHKCIIRHPVEKDDTDSFLAYKLGYEKGYRNFVLYGGIGGRIDHTVANLQMLCNMSKNHSRGFLVGENTVISAIHNGRINFSKENIGKLGVFAHGKDAQGVTISGLRYCVNNSLITSDFPIGVSNEFMGEKAFIEVNDGTLLVIWYENEKDFIRKLKTYLED